MARKAIAIFGGTFDPIHLGHLRSAQELFQRLDLDELRLLPCNVPPHRPPPRADSRHRLAMVRLAVDDTPGLIVDDAELRRQAPSYTVDTLRRLREEVGPEVALCMVVGTDAFNALDSWKGWRELFELAHVVVIERPEHPLAPPPEVAQWVAPRRLDPAAIRERSAGGWLVLKLSQWPLSATALRAALAAGRDVSQWLSPAVWQYILEHNLYTEAGQKS